MAPSKKQTDMGIIAQLSKQFNIQVQEALIHLTESVDRQEVTVHALHAKVLGPERDPVVEACAGFSSRARLSYPQTDANTDNNISRRNNMDIHPV